MRDLCGLEPDVRMLCEQFLRKAAEAKIALVVTQTRRSSAEQATLYAMGRTSPGPIITHAPPGYSWHEFGRAFDVAITDFPGNTTADLYDGPWDEIGNLGESAGLEWGGRWKHPDRPHFQHTGGKTLGQMRAAQAHQKNA